MAERWATFDCYGTLVDWEGGFRGALAALWPDADAQRLLGHQQAVEPRIQLARDLSYREVLGRALEAVAAIEALAVPAGRRDALVDGLLASPPFPDTRAALEEMRAAGWRLAVLSNTDPDLLEITLGSVGFDFDLTITAAEAGSYKPAPGHWEAFFERSGAERSRHVHVGASPFHDLEPAARLGLRAVWINRLGEQSDLPRAAELPDLSALPATAADLVGPDG